jgi:purine nucleosidase
MAITEVDNKRFAALSQDERLRLLQPPSGPVRVVLDSDMANEIDDQFALTWMLLSQDVLKIEGIYAEPFSFQYRAQELKRAFHQAQTDNMSAADQTLIARYAGQIERLQARGVDPLSIELVGPAEGMERSYQEIFTVYDKLGMQVGDLAFRGAPRYLSSLDDPVDSPAVRHLIERALAHDSDDPLYVVAIGCPTNVASALLIEPEIARHIVVTWTSGYPTTCSAVNYSFNLEQDMLASQVLFASGVALVYLPGFHIAAQLRLSLPEVENWVKGQGAIGDYLHHLFTHNPLFPFLGLGHGSEALFGRTWVIWDLINVAWLLNPAWVPTILLPAATLGDDKRWQQPATPSHLTREAYGVDRDAIFRDFLKKLQRHHLT